MPTFKTGSASLTPRTEIMQKHFDLDNQINELLSPLSLELKSKVARKLPEVIADAKRELAMELSDTKNIGGE